MSASTYLKQHFFRRRDDLTRLTGTLLSITREAGIALQSWTVFSNHYHLVAAGDGEALRDALKRVHGSTSRDLNQRFGIEGRKVWHQFRDTQLTFHRSWLARLKYTIYNPVKHGLVANATDYPWCSAAWFERTALPSFVKTLERFAIDRVKVEDDFEVLAPEE